MLIMLLTLGVGQMWGASEGSTWRSASSANVYFDNTNSSYSNVSLLIGRQWNYDSDAIGSWGENLTLVSGTNNLYYKSVTQAHYTTFCFINATNWGWETNTVTARLGYCTNTDTPNDNLGSSTHLYEPASGSDGASVTHTTPASYTALNYTQTLNQTLSTDGGSTFSTSTATIATVKVQANKLNGNSSTTSNTGTISSGSSSTSCDAARTATVTYSVSSVNSGYHFVGWYDGDTQKSTETSYTYNATEAKTITARFIKLKTITIKFLHEETSGWTIQSVTKYPTTGGQSISPDGTWVTMTFTNVYAVSNINLAYSGGGDWDYLDSSTKITDDCCYNKDGSQNASCCVPRANPTWGAAPASGAIGGSMTATVSGAPVGATITWTSTNTSAATVNSSGVISYVAAGNTTIKANVSWSASDDYCAGSYELSQAITVTSGATVTATRTSPEYVPTGVAGQVSMHITFTGTSSGWKYRVKHNWDIGYETDWLDASGSSADWTMTGGVGTGTYAYVVELYSSQGGTLVTTSSPVSVTGEITQTVNIAAGAHGSVSPSGEIRANNNHVHPTITATPNEHYNFVNWTSNNAAASVANPNNATTTVTATAPGYTITANFAGDQYSITYKDQGDVAFSGNHVDSPSAHPTTHTYGTAISLNSATKTGYTFGGWFDNSSCTGEAVTSLGATAYSNDITLYAKWTEVISALSTSCNYDAGNPSYAAPTVSGSATNVGYATTRTITATAAGTGYTFAGWTLTNCTRTDGGAATATTITIRANGDGLAATVVANYNEVLTSRWHLVGENVASKVTFPNGWTVDNTSMMQKATGHSTESVVYANVTVSNADGTYQFKVVDDNGASSDIWYGYSTGGTYLTWTATSTKNVYSGDGNSNNLKFTPTVAGTYVFKVDYSGTYPAVTITYPVSYTLTYGIGTVKGNNGSISTSPSTSSGSKVISGTNITLTGPAAKSGYTWKGWYTNAAGTEGKIPDTDRAITVTMNANKTLYACYTINNHAITHSDASHGSYTIKVGDASAVSTNTTSDYGKTITLAATPATGYHFGSWSAYKTGTPATTVTVTSNQFTMPDYAVTVGATFTPNTYSITYYTNGGSEIAAGSYNIETATFALPTTSTKTGYTFAGWYTNSELTGDAVSSITVGSYGNKEYWAKWDANEYTITLDNQYSDGQGSDGIHEGDVDATHYVVTFGTNWFDHYMLEAPSHGHYTFMGYWSAAGGAGTQILSDLGQLLANTPYTDAEGKWTYPNNVIIYAKWSENQELNKNAGVTAGATNGAITLTYNSSAVSGYTASTRRGYLLDGYFTAASDGNEVITNTGVLAAGPVTNYIADGKWIYENASAPYIYAQWTPVTYTVRFAKNTDPSYLGVETGTDPDEIAATYDAAITLPANPYTRPGYEFLGWAKAEYKAKGSYNAEYPLSDYQYAAGTGTHNISATQESVAVLYPKWVGNVYTVSFNPRGASVYPTSMNVRYGETYGSGNSGSLPEPSSVPTGKTFVGWFTSAVGGTQVTAETQLRTIGAHTLYAHYEDLTQVYFKNTIGWDEVYVTYAAYWDTYSNPSKGTGNNGKIYHKMRLVPGTSDVYYDQVPASIVASWADGNEKIAFNDRELLTDKDKHAPTTGDYDNYNVGEVVYRLDFDSRATMFVPTNNKGTTADGNYVLNGAAQYRSTNYKEGTSSNPEYTSGYWMIFNNTYSGYLFSYQKNGAGDFSAEYGMNGAKAGDSVFVYSVKMDANTRYDLRIRKDCQTTNTKSRQFRYGTQITSGACTDLKLVCDPNNNSWMQTTAAGEYKFILTTKSDGHMYLTVEYPLAVNDYRVLYSYDDGSAKQYASEVIKPIAKDTVDTISVFVHKLQIPVVSRSMKIQQCTNIDGSGNPTWSDVATGTIDLSSVTTNGVYNFAVQQYESGTPTGAFIGKYDGDFYIRTEASDGGWDQYKDREGNVMTYSAYSMTQTLSEPYSHYYCRYVGSTSTDITFAVATKYSPNISGTMIGDAIIGNAATTLPANANVRFSYNEQTNDLERAYIKPAQGAGNERFLVMHGADDNMIFYEGGGAIPASGTLAKNELQFDDMGDWVYQVMLQAVPNAEVSLIAKYNNADRYLIGGASEHEKILGGEGSNKYTIMAIYDFKTNRLMNAWTPDGEISDKLSDIDMLWIRRSDNEAKQITFSGDGSLTNVKVVGAIQLRYNDLVGRVSAWSYETRPLLKYFLSFPFDVNVSDIFGLHGAELGREYVIQKYNAAERAKNGLFLGDGDTYWENLTADSVMHANEGYCLIFDNEYLNGDLGTIWENKAGGSSVYLYFPASHELPSISDEDKGTSLASHLCENTRTYTYGGGTISHANSDSHWNLIGSPLFANSYVIESDGTNGQTGTAARTTLDSYYAYDGNYNIWVPTLYYSEATGKYYACKAMHAMLVQFAGSVTWSKNEPDAPASIVARQKRETTNRLITLNLMQGDEEGDHTYIKMDENGNSDFMLCEDMFKIINKNKPNIFSYAGTNCVAYNKVQVEDMTVNLGVEIRKNGTYTFTMPDNVAGQVTLIDNFAQTRTNLNIEDYEIYLNRGNYYDRFSIEIKVNEAPTAIDGVQDGSGSLKDGKAHKFIMNDMMYIIKDGVLYDARGNRVK